VYPLCQVPGDLALRRGDGIASPRGRIWMRWLACAVVGSASASASASPEELSPGGEDRRPTPVSTPIVILGAGASTDGWSGEVSLGWAWGERDIGWLFRSTRVRRVLVNTRRQLDPADAAQPTTRLAVTYGWYETSKQLMDGGFDLGVTATRGGVGSIARLTLGVGGFGVRLTGGGELGDAARLVGALELVFDLATMARRL
jgi:hypothetical protein